jgi:hypothetical protein
LCQNLENVGLAKALNICQNPKLISNIATHVFVSLQDLLTAEVLLEGLRRRLLVHGVASVGDATQHDNLVGAGFGVDSSSHVYGGDN